MSRHYKDFDPNVAYLDPRIQNTLRTRLGERMPAPGEQSNLVYAIKALAASEYAAAMLPSTGQPMASTVIEDRVTQELVATNPDIGKEAARLITQGIRSTLNDIAQEHVGGRSR